MITLKTKTFINDFKLWDDARLKEVSDKVKKLFTKKVPEYIAEVKNERKIKQDEETKSNNNSVKVPAPGVQINKGTHTFNNGGKIK